MKRVEVTMAFTVPAFYTFDDTAGLVSKLMEPVKEVAKNADVISVVVDEDDDEG
jgi:hypothetical protein